MLDCVGLFCHRQIVRKGQDGRAGVGVPSRASYMLYCRSAFCWISFLLLGREGERGGGREECGKGRVGEKGVGSWIAIHPTCSTQYIASQNCMFRQALKCCAQVFGNTLPATGVPILTELHKVGSVKHGSLRIDESRVLHSIT